MKYIHKILIIIIISALSCSSCSSLKRVKKSHIVIHNTPREEVIDNKRSNPEVKKEPASETPRRVREKVSRKEITPVKVRPKITFNDIESANVRISKTLNDPFAGSEEMILDMNEIAQEFHYPYPGNVISQYGYRGRSMHTGVDIKAVPMDTIRSAMPGVVRMAKPYSDYGNIIVIRHYNGIETLYSHHTKSLVSVNDVVECGEPIALAGRTGRATTEHLHFEVRVASEAINPNLLLDTENQTINSGKLYLYNRAGRITASTSEKTAQKQSEQKQNINQSTPKPATQSTATSSKKYHTIKKGDTLSALARTYSTSVNKICQLNGIKPTKTLSLNEKIRVR